MKLTVLSLAIAMICVGCGLIPPSPDATKGVVHGQASGAIKTQIVQVNGAPNSQHYIFGATPGRYQLGIACSWEIQFVPTVFGAEQITLNVKAGFDYEISSTPDKGRCNVQVAEHQG